MTVEPETWNTLRGFGGMLHFPDPEDPETAVCGEPGLEPHDHPVNAAGMWCTACMQTLVGRGE